MKKEREGTRIGGGNEEPEDRGNMEAVGRKLLCFSSSRLLASHMTFTVQVRRQIRSLIKPLNLCPNWDLLL